MRIALAIAIAVWTLAAWGGRIGLLTSGAGLWTWLRIAGSLLIGLLAAATLAFAQLEPARKPALIVFSVFTVVLWIRSLIVNWAGDASLPFKVVHTALALGFFALSWWAFTFVTSAGETARSPDAAASSDALP
jgi:uncharacterized membrane protein